MFQSPQIISVVLDQHRFLHSHLKIRSGWVEWLWAHLDCPVIPSLSRLMDSLALWTLGNPLSVRFEFWKFLQGQLLFLNKEPIFAFYSECREKVVLNWWPKRHNLTDRRKECPFWVGLVFAFLISAFHFFGLRSLWFFSISVLYSDHYDCLIGITE